MKTYTTVKRIFGIPYMMIVKKVYYTDDNGSRPSINLTTNEKYIFDIKVSKSQTTFESTLNIY